jgi:DNA polymerase III epsilon subunit-like protein
MVDLETLGLSPDSAIVSVGAVVFTKDGIEAEGYWPLYLDQPGRDVDLNTLKWWLQQDDAARAVFAEKNLFSLKSALEHLAEQFCDGTRIWSNGANFDEVLLSSAYKQLRMRTPWSYKHVRCFRTIRAQYPDIVIPEQGVKHNALDDARWQAQYLIEIMKQKGIELL